jgi:hypothetical protein
MGGKMKPLTCLLLLVGMTLAADPAPTGAPVPPAKLWAALSVTAPVIGADDVTDPGFFSVSFALVNDGDKVINPEIGSSQFLVNGKELKDWSFIIANGPRGKDFEALPPGECLRFGYALGKHFTEPGIYKVKWKGKGFESPEVVFRVLPRKER